MAASVVHYSLETVPDEILSVFVNYLNMAEVSALMSASKRLHRRISNCQQPISLVYRAPDSKTRFPKFPYCFSRLVSFSLHIPGYGIHYTRISSSDIMSLPPTLQSIDLNFFGCHSIWYKNYDHRLSKKTFTTNITGSQSDLESVYDLKAAFPVLQRLALGGENAQLVVPILVFFSETLYHVWLSNIDYTVCDINCPLPSQLITLDIQGGRLNGNHHLSPLIQLETLKMQTHTSRTPEYLPPTLTDLYLAHDLQCTEQFLSTFATLRHLTSLHIPAYQTLFPYLTHSLTSLEIVGSTPPTPDDIKSLPKSLLTLCIHPGLDGDLSDFSFWPPALQSLSFRFSEGEHRLDYNDDRWLSLPKTLTMLETISGPFYVNPLLLPPKLKKLSITQTEGQAGNYSNCTDLTHLTVYSRTTRQMMSFYGIQTQRNTSESDKKLGESSSPFTSPATSPELMFPPKLQHLSWNTSAAYQMRQMQAFVFTNESASLLPATLTHFYCEDARNLDDTFFSLLPRGLTYLRLPRQYQLNFTGEGLKHLPPRLIELETAIQADSDDSFVPELPRGLTSLIIHDLTSLSDSMVPQLPRGLTKLHLRRVKHGLTDASIAHFPMSLRDLILKSNRTWTPEAFFAAPWPKLKDFDIRSNRNFTKHVVKQLAPERLRILCHKFKRYYY